MLRFLCALLLLLPLPASSAIISGQITGGNALGNGGTFIEIFDLDNYTIGGDQFDDFNLRGFNERQNLIADAEIATNVGRNVLAGEMVASHYIFFDPGSPAQVQASLFFDSPIIGVATSTVNLHRSDDLMHREVTYESVAARGLENNDSVQLFASDPTRLDLVMLANSPGDFIRVFTEMSQRAVDLGISEATTPLPPAGVLVMVSLFGYGCARRAFDEKGL